MVEHEFARLGIDAGWLRSRPDRVRQLILFLIGIVDVNVKTCPRPSVDIEKGVDVYLRCSVSYSTESIKLAISFPNALHPSPFIDMLARIPPVALVSTEFTL